MSTVKIALGAFLLAAASAAHADTTVTLGDPDLPPGIDEVEDTFEFCTKKNDPASCTTIKIKVSRTDTADSKAEKLYVALKGTKAYGTKTLKNDNKVFVGGVQQVNGVNNSKQKLTVAQAGLVVPGGQLDYADTARIDFHGALSGLAANGSEAVYQSSIGHGGGGVADADVSFSALSSPTVAGLLKAVFAQLQADLPDPLKSSLQLNLAEEAIDFSFAGATTDAFVSNYSSDTGLNTTSGFTVTMVPEPSAWGLAGLGALIVLGARKGKGRLGRPETTTSSMVRRRLLL